MIIVFISDSETDVDDDKLLDELNTVETSQDPSIYDKDYVSFKKHKTVQRKYHTLQVEHD